MWCIAVAALISHSLSTATAVILPKHCPEVCVPRESCPQLPDSRIKDLICQVSEEGDLFVCCDPTPVLPLVVPINATTTDTPSPAVPNTNTASSLMTNEGERQQSAATTGPNSIVTDPSQDTLKSFKCPLDASNGDCGLVSADRVASGELAHSGQFPWTASLFFRVQSLPNPVHLCGGTLITPRHVLTAGHCLVQQTQFNNRAAANLTEIRLGDRVLSTDPDCSTSGQVAKCDPPVQIFTPGKVTVHPEYSETRKRVLNDVAVIELDRSAEINAVSVFPVCLPCQDVSKVDAITAKGAVVTVSGWGAVDGVIHQSDVLRYANIPLISFERCQASFSLGTFLDKDLHICAGGTFDSCRGDSGGPLTTIDDDGVNYLIGIVSYGLTAQCQKGGIGVYAKIENYIDWISSVIGD